MKRKTTIITKALCFVIFFCSMVFIAGSVFGNEFSDPTGTTETLPSMTDAAMNEETVATLPEAKTDPSVFVEDIQIPTVPMETVPSVSEPIPTEPATTEPPAEPVPEPTVDPADTSAFPKCYSDDTCSITIYKEWYEDAWCYIAHIQFTDFTRFGTSCANGKYDNGYETTSHAAKRLDAILTVNGCYSAPSLNYIVVRGGKVCNGSGRNLWCPAIYSTHNGLLLSAWETGGTPGITGSEIDSLVADGLVTDTFCFGPPILVDGKVTAGSNKSRAQRTFIGTNGEPGDIWLVISEGRYADGVSAGLTGSQCARLLAEKGCTFAVPLDGGGSTTMVFQGEVLNSVKKQRPVVDFIFFK